jgi:hypothetical protein
MTTQQLGSSERTRPAIDGGYGGPSERTRPAIDGGYGGPSERTRPAIDGGYGGPSERTRPAIDGGYGGPSFDYYDFQLGYVQKTHEDEVSALMSLLNNDESNMVMYMPSVVEYMKYLKNRFSSKKYKYTAFYHLKTYCATKLSSDEHKKELEMNTYMKPWNKLREIHKKLKTEEYIKQLPYDPKLSLKKKENNIRDITEEIVLGFKAKRFAKNKNTIEYDMQLMKITNISAIHYNEKTLLYEVIWA